MIFYLENRPGEQRATLPSRHELQPMNKITIFNKNGEISTSFMKKNSPEIQKKHIK